MFKSFNLCRKALFSTAMASAKEPRIFFGGLPVGYTEFAIKNLFKDCGEIKTIEFFRKDESGANKGYGTILFADENALNKALEMNEQQVAGRPMTIKAWEGEYKDAEASRKTVNTKINFPPSEIVYIGNLRFDQDADELINIFAEMGNVISFRRPYDAVNKRSKGIAYIQFDSLESSAKAIQALNGYELNGRTIRVDYSAERQKPSE